MREYRRHLEGKGAGTVLIGGIVVLVLARLLVIALLGAVYSTLGRLLWLGSSASVTVLTSYDVLQLLLNRWIWTVYIVCGAAAGVVAWRTQDTEKVTTYPVATKDTGS
ncbi:MAG: hypothetical protein HPY54_15205 [Chthonomonadetes bacterium]|nr:hypothetical protein [Chthonomonadetes bacterium]